jgi:hypothetical protein
MKDKSYCILNAVVIALVINLLLPFLMEPFATPDEIKPPSCPSELSYKSQFMHMMIHHHKTPLALIVGLSVYLGYLVKPVNHVMAVV